MLEGKTVIVTGAAKGIGRAVALAFAQKGANIVLNYRSNLPSELPGEIEQYGVQCLPVCADVSVFEQAKHLIDEAVGRFQSVDVLVNNAGITRDTLLLRMGEEDYDAVMNTNMKGTFNTTRHVIGLMLKQRSGAIINLSSVVGEVGNVGQANYAASKAAVIGFTKATAKEVAARGVTCNAIAPGFIETDMTAALSDKIREQMQGMIPLKKFGAADDVAKTAVFLAENRYITGQVVNVDGGMVM